MNIFLILAFLFFIGSLCGYVLELFYRRFFSSANPSRRWINPGFCVGPYIPLYGEGLCLLYLVASLEAHGFIHDPLWNKLALFALMALLMTAIEYIAGLFTIKCFKVRLWDYSTEWGNINGIICPKFSLFWAFLGAGYYFLIHPHILEALAWLSANLAFSFFIGMFFGFFTVDVVYSSNLILKLKKFAAENNLVVKSEHFKAYIRQLHEERQQKIHFIFAYASDNSLPELLTHYGNHLREKAKRLKK